MLAPGEHLTRPTEPPTAGPRTTEPPPALPPGSATGPAPTTGDEPESFLMILLRALGAIHT